MQTMKISKTKIKLKREHNKTEYTKYYLKCYSYIILLNKKKTKKNFDLIK